MPKSGQSDTSGPNISKAEMEFCLARVLSSQVFSGADRLQGFLRYVVQETVEGRARGIRGKTIALDVYGRDASSDGDPENVVRVDARRLRRRLSDYYEADGRNDPIRIHIDSGGYAPRFEVISPSIPDGKTETSASRRLRTLIATASIVACAALILIGLYTWVSWQGSPTNDIVDLKKLERQALLEKSHTTLQAVNLAEQARGMVWPLFDLERQKLALSIFEQAIRLDPEYFGGYVGTAQSLGALAVLSHDPAQKAAYLKRASDRLDKAISLNPTDAWTQSSAAWVAFASDEYDRAFQLSGRAFALRADDWYISDIHGIIALFTGNFIEARNVSNPSRARHNSNQRSGNRNIYAAASFHLGDFKSTLASFQAIGELGGPVSVLRVAYQSAAKHALGDIDGARASAAELMDTWPNSRVDIMLLSLFENPAHADEVLKRLAASGWKAGK